MERREWERKKSRGTGKGRGGEKKRRRRDGTRTLQMEDGKDHAARQRKYCMYWGDRGRWRLIIRANKRGATEPSARDGSRKVSGAETDSGKRVDNGWCECAVRMERENELRVGWVFPQSAMENGGRGSRAPARTKKILEMSDRRMDVLLARYCASNDDSSSSGGGGGDNGKKQNVRPMVGGCGRVQLGG